MNKNFPGIKLTNVNLDYISHHDKTLSFKEFIINKITKKKYVEEKKTFLRALDQVSLELKHGERLGILGHNGAGKSTLLKIISGILKPTGGEINVGGSIQPLIEIAAGFNYELSGRENIYLNGYMLGFTRSQIIEKEQEIIDFSELAEFIDTPVKYYSSGMSVRLAFAIATSIEPEYLIFDELLSAGDARFQEKANQRIKALLDKAKIIVLASHSLETIRKTCSRSIVLKRGKIIFDGNTDEAIDHYLRSENLKT